MRAVELIFGTSFPTLGPGTSALITCIEFSRLFGWIAIMKTSMPIPPIQWVNILQKAPHLDSDSTSVTMEEPVVVKPETVSKNEDA